MRCQKRRRGFKSLSLRHTHILAFCEFIIMSYLVLARKYRPQTFAEVIKQKHVTQTLCHAIESGRVVHAILFTGPRGTGKTTIARILAKALNCENGPTTTPCNACRSCKEITSGQTVDVFEIDGASNNSVDQIRDLRDNVRYMPSRSRYKIYIIDEVHMLTAAAFNALLKTLEEPPAHVLFMFATTEPQKIPLTILSRCQRHDLRRIDARSIVEHLQTLCLREQVDITAESLHIIAQEAGGSMRDALSLLDQIMSFSGGKITHELILNMLGVIDREYIFDFSQAVLNGDFPAVLDFIESGYDNGMDLKRLYAALLEHFRNLLVIRIGHRVQQLVDFPQHEIERMQEQVKPFSVTALNHFFDMLFSEEAAIRYTAVPRLALETVFFRIIRTRPSLPIDELIDKLDRLRKEFADPSRHQFVEEQSPYESSSAEVEPAPLSRPEKPDIQPEPKVQPAAIPLERLRIEDMVSSDACQAALKRIIEKISEKTHALGSVLSQSRLAMIDNDTLGIYFSDNGYNIKQARKPKNETLLKSVIIELFEKSLKVVIHAENKPDQDSHVRLQQSQQLKQEVLNHPLVASAIEIFGGTVVDIKIEKETGL